MTPDGLDAIEEGIDLINAIVFYGTTPETPITADMWKLYPQMLTVTAGVDGDVDGGFGWEYLTNVTTAV